jgi:hypothetical protein
MRSGCPMPDTRLVAKAVARSGAVPHAKAIAGLMHAFRAKRVPDARKVVTSRQIKAGAGSGDTRAMSSVELDGL